MKNFSFALLFLMTLSLVVVSASELTYDVSKNQYSQIMTTLRES